MNIETLKSELIRDESLKLRPYLDCCSKPWRECTCTAKGKLTIGCGRNLDDVGISGTEALFLLESDIARATVKAAKYPWFPSLSDNRQRVIVNMLFNMGSIEGFHDLLAALQVNDYERAAAAMLDSDWAREVKARAERLADMMRQG